MAPDRRCKPTVRGWEQLNQSITDNRWHTNKHIVVSVSAPEIATCPGSVGMCSPRGTRPLQREGPTTLFSQSRRLFRFDISHCIFNGSLVSVRPKPADHRFRFVAKVAMVPESFTLVDVAYVHLDEGDVHAGQGVPKSYTGMRQSTWVDNDRIDVPSCFVDAVDQYSFVVRLNMCERDRLP